MEFDFYEMGQSSGPKSGGCYAPFWGSWVPSNLTQLPGPVGRGLSPSREREREREFYFIQPLDLNTSTSQTERTDNDSLQTVAPKQSLLFIKTKQPTVGDVVGRPILS